MTNVARQTYGELSGQYAVWSNKQVPIFNFNKGTVVIKDTTVTANEGALFNVNLGDGTQYTNVTIESGTFGGAFIVEGTSKKQGSFVVTGGTFASNPEQTLSMDDAQKYNYVAKGYEAVDNNNGTWTVEAIKVYVAQIGETKYETLKEAFATATSGDTITMIGDATIDTRPALSTGKAVVLDLNGHTITPGADYTSYGLIQNQGTLTIRDSVGTGGMTRNNTTSLQRGLIRLYNSTLTIESGSYMCYDTNEAAEDFLQNYKANSCTVVITGGTFNTDPSAYVADGYEAHNNGNGTWTVRSTAAQVTVEEGETITVTEEEGTATVSVGENAAVATVATSGEEVNANNVDVAALVEQLVADGKISTGANTVVFTLDKDEKDATETNTVTYDVVPKLSVNGGDAVEVSNSQLSGPVTFKLAAPSGASVGDLITATHTYEADAEANITAGSEVFKNLEVDSEGYVTLTLTHFSEVTLSKQDAALPDAIIRSMNGVFGNVFVLNFYVTTDVTDPSFALVREYDSHTLEKVSSRTAFYDADQSVFYVEKVSANGHNGLGLNSTYGAEAYMVSVKLFTKFLDQAVTLSMKDSADNDLYIQGYTYGTVGTDTVATSHAYAFTD